MLELTPEEYDPTNASMRDAFEALNSRGLIGGLFQVTPDLHVFASHDNSEFLLANYAVQLPTALYYHIPEDTTAGDIGESPNEARAVQVEFFDAFDQHISPGAGYAGLFIPMSEALVAPRVSA